LDNKETFNRKRTYDRPIFTHFKKHTCPKCGNILSLKKETKTVNSKSNEAKDFDFSAPVEGFIIGKVTFIWDEFICRDCYLKLKINELYHIELFNRRAKNYISSLQDLKLRKARTIKKLFNVLYRRFERNRHLGQTALPLLLNYNEESTRTWAAIHMLRLGLNTEDARVVLKEVANGSGIMCDDAKRELEDYERKNFMS